MKKNNIILISLIIVVLTALCTIAGTYAVIINVTNENGTDKIINNIMREINWDGSNDIEKIKIFNKKFKEVFSNCTVRCIVCNNISRMRQEKDDRAEGGEY